MTENQNHLFTNNVILLGNYYTGQKMVCRKELIFPFASILHLKSFISIYIFGTVSLIFIESMEVQVASWLDFELDCVPSVDVLLTRGVGFCCERRNGYFLFRKPIHCTFSPCT